MTKAILPPTKAVGTTTVENGNKAGLARGGEDEIELVEQTSGSLPESSNGNGNGNGIAGDAHDHEDALAVDETAKIPLELQTDIYVTQLPSKWEEKVDEDEDDDETLPGEYNVHHGRRPDVYAILQQIQTEAVREGWPRVFVMGSGPSSMLRELQIACQNSQLQNLQIDFEQVVFGHQ